MFTGQTCMKFAPGDPGPIHRPDGGPCHGQSLKTPYSPDKETASRKDKYSSQFGRRDPVAYFAKETESFSWIGTEDLAQFNVQARSQCQAEGGEGQSGYVSSGFGSHTQERSWPEMIFVHLVDQIWDQKSQAQLKPRDSSVEVRSDWEVKEEMDFPRLMKMRYMEVADPLDM
ncbi:eukaryotic translation initiation factor 3 subunit D isoform X1 [Lates japonicus]|uniref:Eukaryotic translation initiation factor 3 subunit D isoform X1 n=1 Tax=Lates japonicus TaxID=270547 RepID=A0AAD3M7J0_LATJO|nr:eukaryotic translation initiation factor 3 subunit D isoform X1 [Lates japonicus]